MTEVLVLVDHVDGKITKSAAELLTLARRLGAPSAVIVGGAGAAKALATELAAHGTAKVSAAETDSPAFLTPSVEVLVALVGSTAPAAVLIAASADGREIAGRVAFRTESALLGDVIDVAGGDPVTVSHSVFGGAYLATARPSTAHPVITVRPGSVDVEPGVEPGAVTAEPVEVPPGAARSATVRSREPATRGDRPELAEASVVVSGGRGVGSADQFAVVEGLADVLGGAVGASRAAVDSGYYPHQFQVGQTGKTVSPQLYIALGISGAIQHRAGMQTSKTIVAVNKDPEAPIFEIADFGVVGDLFAVTSQLQGEVEKRKS